MSQISKRKLNQRVYKQIFKLFPNFFTSLSRRGSVNTALKILLSSSEQIMIAKRLAISFMLIKGYTYTEIMDKLKVSRGTVGKMAELTKNADSNFITELNKMAKEDAFLEFLSSIDYQFSKLLPPKGRNWSVWRRNLERKRREEQQPF